MRSLEDLQLKVLMFSIDPPNEGPNYIPSPPHLWLFVGMVFFVHLMTYKLAGRRHLMHTARTPFRHLARHLRPDSPPSRPLVEILTSRGDFDHREPIIARSSLRDPAHNSLPNNHSLKRIQVPKTMASVAIGNGFQWEEAINKVTRRRGHDAPPPSPEAD